MDDYIHDFMCLWTLSSPSRIVPGRTNCPHCSLESTSPAAKCRHVLCSSQDRWKSQQCYQMPALPTDQIQNFQKLQTLMVVVVQFWDIMLEEIDNCSDCSEQGKYNVWTRSPVCMHKHFLLIIQENPAEREENISYWIKWAPTLQESCRVSGLNQYRKFWVINWAAGETWPLAWQASLSISRPKVTFQLLKAQELNWPCSLGKETLLVSSGPPMSSKVDITTCSWRDEWTN